VRHSVPRSPRAGAALSSGGEREMMTGRALLGLTRSDLQTVRPEAETAQM